MEFEKDNPDVLSSLYALRGGLSAIAVEYDRARRLDGEYHEQLNSIADRAGGARYEAPQGTVEYAEWLQNGGFQNELYRRYNNIQENDVTDYKETSYGNSEKRGRRDAKITFLIMSIGLIVAIASIVGLFLIFTRCAYYKFKYVVLIFVLIVVTAFALFWTIYWMCCGFKDIRDFKKDGKIAREAKEKNTRMTAVEKKRVEDERRIAQANIDRLPQVCENARACLNERNGKILPMVQSCNVYYRALLEQFNPLLDERDWQHLDLVIYEIETRRADSIKEALQLVDRELQTERIERTIGEATKAICYTLARGFTALQQSIKVCCDKICTKLDTISSQLDTMSLQMAVQSMQLAGISGQLADLTDSVNVSNALQAKANVTSAQLCNDVHAMRYYS